MASPYDAQYNSIRSRIEFYANKYGIPPKVAVAQIWQESRFKTRAGSSAGAQGIAQFIPATARRFGVNVWDVESSLDGWGRYMSQMMRQFNGRIDIALAGYNSGESRSEYRAAAAQGREINWSVMPAGVRSETQNYVKTIMAASGGSSVSLNGSPSPENSSSTMAIYAVLAALVVGLLITD